MTEDEKQRYFEEGYDQCFREVIASLKENQHPDRKYIILYLQGIFKNSASKMDKESSLHERLSD